MTLYCPKHGECVQESACLKGADCPKKKAEKKDNK